MIASRAFSFGAALIVAGGLIGCMEYQYAGRRFSTAERALAATRVDIDTALARVPRDPTPLHGKLAFSLPDRDSIDTILITRGADQAPSQERDSYVVQSAEMQFRAIAQGLQQSNLFIKVDELARDATPEEAKTAGYDCFLRLRLPGPGMTNWRFYKLNAGTSAPIEPALRQGAGPYINSACDQVRQILASPPSNAGPGESTPGHPRGELLQ